MKFVHGAGYSLLFVFLLLTVYLVHARYFTVDVVFYAAILDGAIAAALTFLALLLFRAGRLFNPFEKSLLLVAWLLAGYGFAISVPTVIDRSLSLYILEKLQQRGGAIRLDRFEEVFTKEYLVEHRLMDVRLTEQSESGTLRIDGDCVRLTEKGERIAGWSRAFRLHLLPKKRLLMGEYTDDLTDPFRESIEAPDYGCE